MTVYLRGGNYNLNDTFKLSQEDSGEAGAPVVWEAYITGNGQYHRRCALKNE